MTREDAAGGGSFIAFSHSSWNNYIYKAGIVCAQNKQNKGSQVRRTKKESYESNR